jgi:hypothetical protein
MTEDHMTLAYFLALSDVESDKLCEKNTFTTMFFGRSFTWLEREQIGSEAGAIRGNEEWDWVVPGATVKFYIGDIRFSGIVESVELDQFGYPVALVRRPNRRQTYRLEFYRLQEI